MSLLIPQRRGPASPVGGKLALNRAHPYYSAVQFAWNARSGTGLQDMTGRVRLTAGSAGGFVSRQGVYGASGNAASTLLTYTLPSERVSAFTSDVTMLWRGVILGDNTTNYPRIIGVHYGDSSGSPYEIAGISRGNAVSNVAIFGSNDGANYGEASFTTNFQNKYGIPLTMGASNAVAQSNVHMFILWDDGSTFDGIGAMGGSSGNPRASTTNNQICIGGAASDATRFANVVTESAVILNRAVYLGDSTKTTLPKMVRDYASFFTVVGASRALALPFMVDPPPAEAGGSSGYKPFKGPFGHPFNVPF